jgi:hypothetical protein
LTFHLSFTFQDPAKAHNKKGAVKKSSQEKRLRSCQKARQQSFFVV